ncbi:MAG TPA: hypothetical protein VNT60_03265, partial [Deinococcales bacterium]|nr:hypothetical protein [Deinococcales bacterium]
MEEAFGTVVVIVALVAAIAAVLSYIGAGSLYKGIGKGGLSLDEPEPRRGPKPGSAAWRVESEAEMRQMLEAKSYRAQARGEPALDIDAEMAALTRSPAAARDAELEEEVRQLVIAGNERRARRGEEPLDVDAEVERQLRD